MRPKLITRDGVTLPVGRWARRLKVSRQRAYQLIQGDTIRFPGEPAPKPELSALSEAQLERARKLAIRRRDRYRLAHSARQIRHCGNCGGEGHNRRSCASTKGSPEKGRQ